MTEERWNDLMWGDVQAYILTPEEIAQGWHWCDELDGCLVNPDEEYLPFCWCLGRQGKAIKPPNYPIPLDESLI